MKEAARKLEVQVGDGAERVLVGDQFANDLLRPLQAPEDRPKRVSLSQVEVCQGEPYTSCPFS